MTQGKTVGERAKAIVEKLWGSKSPIGLNVDERKILEKITTEYLERGISYPVSVFSRDDYRYERLKDEGIVSMKYAGHETLMELTRIEQEEFENAIENEGMEKGGSAGDVVDTLNMDVPLFIRMLEYAKEDAKTDMDLHKVTENAVAISKSSDTLTMNNYNSIISGDGIMEKGGNAGEKMITLYHFFGSWLQDGSLYAPFSIHNNKWTDKKEEAERLFNEADLSYFKPEELEENKNYYRDGVLLFELQSTKVPENIWRNRESIAKARGYDDGNDLINAVSDYDWNTVKERAIFQDGDKVSKKELSEYFYAKGGSISSRSMTLLEDSPVNINFRRGTFSEQGLSKEQVEFLKQMEKLWREDKLNQKSRLATIEKYKHSGRGEEILDALEYWESLYKPIDKESAFHPVYLSDYLNGGGSFYLQINVGYELNSRNVSITPKLENLLKKTSLLYPVSPKNYYFNINDSGNLYIHYQSIIGSRMIASNVIIDFKKGGDTSSNRNTNINWLITG